MTEEKKYTEEEIKAFLGQKLKECEPYLVKQFQDNMVFGIPFESDDE